MAIPTTLESLSATAASNGPAGTDQRTIADDGLRQAFAFIKQLKALDTLASATTITPPSTANVFSISGNTTITTIASTNSWNGRDIWFVFAGALTLTHGSNLLLPGSANITTATSDTAMFTQRASGQWRCAAYQRADNSVTAGNISASGTLTVTGTGTFNGNNVLGNANTDTLTIAPDAITWSNNPTHSGNHKYSGIVLLGTTTASGQEFGLDVLHSSARCLALGNSVTNAADKTGRIAVRHFTNAEQEAAVIGAISTTSTNVVQVGGGSSVLNAATAINFYVAEDNATLTGTLAGVINSDAVSFHGSSLVVTSDGRVYGDAIHNNAGDVTGETNQYICSGLYTPTLTDGTNVAASTARAGQWTRVGNVVNVSGTLDVDPTAASGTQTILGISLPIASDLTAVNQCSGTAISNLLAGGVLTSAAQIGSIQGDATNNRAVLYFNSSTTNNVIFSYQFQYLILD